ncbi:MAG: DUF58 domain-containing protein [Lachnospiraceae bacterium]|jgi:uncharacterized protein (DUF58 family)|nr:DUF58 domain-containing protein [Lachnospiraceae bacterium]
MIRLLCIGLLFFLLILAQKLIYEKLWRRGLRIEILFSPEHLFEGSQGELKEIIENRKRLPLAMLTVKFRTDRNLHFQDGQGARITDQFYRSDVFRVGSREKVTRTLRFTCGRRGYYTVDAASLVASDLLMTGRMIAEVPLKTEIYVYPRPWISEELRRTLMSLNGEVLTRQRLLEDPFEYRGIRDYQPSDDMRSINWKATARTGDLKVNQKNYTSLKSVRIFFNIQDNNIMKKEDCVELSFRIVAGLCSWFLGQGMQVSCFGNGVDILTGKHVSIPARAGEGQLDAICRALARVDTAREPVSFPGAFEELLFSGDGSVLTCFVAPNQYEDFVLLLKRYQAAGRDFVWFYPVQGCCPDLPLGLEKQIRTVHSL